MNLISAVSFWLFHRYQHLFWRCVRKEISVEMGEKLVNEQTPTPTTPQKQSPSSKAPAGGPKRQRKRVKVMSDATVVYETIPLGMSEQLVRLCGPQQYIKYTKCTKYTKIKKYEFTNQHHVFENVRFV